MKPDPLRLAAIREHYAWKYGYKPYPSQPSGNTPEAPPLRDVQFQPPIAASRTAPVNEHRTIPGCTNCGGPLPDGRTKFCSDACSDVVKRKAGREQYGHRHQFVCTECGAELHSGRPIKQVRQ